MANFNKDIPWYDVTKKHTSRNTTRLRKAHQDNTPFVYFSDYRETGKWMKESRRLRKQLHSETMKIYRALRAEIPRGEGTGGHVENALRIRFLKHGGMFRDRMAFHIYTMASGSNSLGDQFVHAERRSRFSKDAWAKRKSGAVVSDRTGWVDSALGRVGKNQAKPRKITQAMQKRVDQARKKKRDAKWRAME